ncbi:hypothetical protein V6N12_001585 [Hibiscus sabdariffa]|uniref:Uncharacterized protein n=1 Tax=Hibiscus sabdariffa TaxID=183260 RepID=A0ABR2ALN3_9ROSI
MVPSIPLYVVPDKSTGNSPVSNEHNVSEASPAVDIPVSEGNNSNDSLSIILMLLLALIQKKVNNYN